MQIFCLPDIFKEGEIEERVGQILGNNLYPEEKVRHCLDFIFGRKKPNKKTITIIRKDFHSDQYVFDSVYKFKMLIAYSFVHADLLGDGLIAKISEMDLQSKFFDKVLNREGESNLKMSPENLRKINRALSRHLKAPDKKKGTLPNSKKMIASKRSRIKKKGEELTMSLRPQIQNRLALLELFTLTSPDDFIPDLLKVCPKYLSCPIVSEKILKWAHGTKEGNKIESKIFSLVCSSLKNKRTSAQPDTL